MGTGASSLVPAGVADHALETKTNTDLQHARTVVNKFESRRDHPVSIKWPVTFGRISWTDDKAAVWHLELRRICLSIRRELRSRPDSAACRVPCQYFSPPFRLPGHPDNPGLEWQLSLVPLEHSMDTVSLYIQSVSVQGPDSGLTVIASFSLHIRSLQKACGLPALVISTGVQQVIPLASLQQLEQAGYAEVEFRLQALQLHSESPVAGILTCTDPHITLISLQPRILLIDNFLPPADCQVYTPTIGCVLQRIINLAWPDLRRSKVATGDMTPSRTSCSTFLTNKKASHPDIQCFEERVSQLIALPAVMHGRRPLAKGEAVQVVRYQPGEFYAEHFDNKADDCTKRACTIMAYLSDVESGGETHFRRSPGCPVQVLEQGFTLPTKLPDSVRSSVAGSPARTGLRIPPKQGRAIMFWSRGLNGEEDRASLHSGEPVWQGEKWIASRWLQEPASCCLADRKSIEE